MITLVFSVIANLFFGQVTSVSGFGGISGIPIPDFLSRTAHPDRLYFVTLAVALLVYALLRYVARTPFGLTLQGIRDDPVRMSSLGYNVDAAPHAGLRLRRLHRRDRRDPLRLVERADRAVDDRPERDHRRAGDRGHRRAVPPRGRLAGRARLRAHQQLRAGHRPGLRALPHADRRHLPGHRPRVAQRPHRPVGARHGGAAGGRCRWTSRRRGGRPSPHPSVDAVSVSRRRHRMHCCTRSGPGGFLARASPSQCSRSSSRAADRATTTRAAARRARPRRRPARARRRPRRRPTRPTRSRPSRRAAAARARRSRSRSCPSARARSARSTTRTWPARSRRSSQFAGRQAEEPQQARRTASPGGAIGDHPLKLVGVGCGDDTLRHWRSRRRAGSWSSSTPTS